MKKYLKLSQDELNKEALVKEQLEENLMEEEIDSSLEGVDKITKEQVKAIAEQKMEDLNAASVEAAMKMVAGTARSMGVVVVD